ncbi:MAG: methanogen output domain 1-containing protein [Candidatus Aenigmatarchaeota archaeon]
MEKKIEELKEIEDEIYKRLEEKERMKMLGNITSKIICTMAKYLIKDTGYSATKRIIERELREIGKNDAERITELIGIKEKTPENASKALKIAALILGLTLDVMNNNTVIKECPYGSEVLKFKDPFFCVICNEYCRGIVEKIAGENYMFVQTSSLTKGDEFCSFEVKKRF